jgi:hypothetical protein
MKFKAFPFFCGKKSSIFYGSMEKSRDQPIGSGRRAAKNDPFMSVFDRSIINPANKYIQVSSDMI